MKPWRVVLPLGSWVRAAGAALLLLVPLAARAERTLWLVRPLYPGQEALITRTEQAIHQLMPMEGRQDEIIGRRELTASLKKTSADLSCLVGQKACSDPIDGFVGSLGFHRIVLVRGGQDEAGYQFKVTSYKPGSGEKNPAEARHVVLEKALLGALVKVVPLASELEVKTTPVGATVYVDDVKVGTTPLSTQVIPGEHVLKLDLKQHSPVEESLVIPVRGSVKVDRSLEKVAARITVSATPPGAEIYLDGQLAGKDKVDRGIQPGNHTLRLQAAGHRNFETQIVVKPEDHYLLDKGLEPIGGPSSVVVVSSSTVAASRPNDYPATIYDRGSYFQVGVDSMRLTGLTLVGQRYGTGATGKTDTILSGQQGLLGLSGEYGTFGRYFGMTVVGLAYYQPNELLRMSVVDPEPDSNGDLRTEIDAKVWLMHIRALQPQFRIAIWRFMASLQGGLELRTGRILEEATEVVYTDGFHPIDLLVTGKANLKAFLFDGLFLEGSYLMSWNLTGVSAGGVRSSGVSGFNVGVGYAY